MSKPLTALIVAHDARATGGVNNFLRIMRRKMRPRVASLRFANGRRHGEKGKLATLRRMAWDYVRFAGLLRRRAFDVIHINPTLDLSSLPRELVFIWLAKAFQPGAKRMLFFRGWDWSALGKIRASGLRKRLFLATLARVDSILVLSSRFKSALIDDGVAAEKIHVVSTMFEGDTLKAVLAKALPKKPHLLVFMSRFLPAKGGGLVLEALADVLTDYPDTELVMAGDGPDRARLEAMARELGVDQQVEFTGYVGGERKMTLLAEASMFLLPTKHPEGMPNAILEAMAAGNVIISTDIGGIIDVVHHQENGVILDPIETGPLISAIRQYFSDPDLMAQTQRRNLDKAWSHWESAIVADGIADLYAQMLAAPAC